MHPGWDPVQPLCTPFETLNTCCAPPLEPSTAVVHPLWNPLRPLCTPFGTLYGRCAPPVRHSTHVVHPPWDFAPPPEGVQSFRRGADHPFRSAGHLLRAQLPESTWLAVVSRSGWAVRGEQDRGGDPSLQVGDLERTLGGSSPARCKIASNLHRSSALSNVQRRMEWCGGRVPSRTGDEY